jgi:[protein-PII] uridylyltransferase
VRPPDTGSGKAAGERRGSNQDPIPAVAAGPGLTDMQLFFTGPFDRALAATSTPIELFRHTLQEVDQSLAERFRRQTPVGDLVCQRAWFIDELLIRAWERFFAGRGESMSLVAVGGYGRGELHPHSDVDLLILLEDAPKSDYLGTIEPFLAFLWDIGIKVGHSARTVDECVEEAGRDVTVATNVMESRRLAGSQALFDEMRERTGPRFLWPTRAFFEAKLEEQTRRHRKFHDTAYNLEPNVKDGPGGLRDIQTVGWVAKRHFGAATLQDLVTNGFLTSKEHQDLMQGQAFLWKVRYALHLLADRNENRLLFDYQQAIAREFGYQDDRRHLAVEKFMKDYYRTVTELSRLNEMLLQLFEEVILHPVGSLEAQPINRRFRARGGFIEATDPNVFKRYPFALLEIFLLLEQHPEIRGVRAATIRLIRDHRHLIDQRFRDDLRCRSLFMEILRQPQGITHVLRRMNRYGVLGAYFPAFGEIAGQMQYDLFHVYTVDEHTLIVVRNLRRFTVPEHEHEFSLCSKIIRRIPKPELLYLAAMFHDIAKGRGGDHSTLGAEDAYEFCLHHGLSDYDARLVAWLVQHHLLMSTTAQQRDIADPDIIFEFAKTVGDPTKLDYLYLLTVADIRATNPTLWNNWKDALLKELYAATRTALNRGLENPVDRREQIAATRAAATALLRDVDPRRVAALWNEVEEDEYFLRHSPDEIAWQSRLVISADKDRLPLIELRQGTARGGTEIFLYTHDQEHLFALTTGALDQLGLNVVSARIITTRDGYTLDTYIVLDETGNNIRAPLRIQEIKETIARRIALRDVGAARVGRRTARQLRHFLIPTQVVFSEDIHRRHTVMELVTVDRPGLLARVGRAFVKCRVRVQNAKIATFGERVEDVFFITDRDNHPLDDEAQLTLLRDTLTEYLDEL